MPARSFEASAELASDYMREDIGELALTRTAVGSAGGARSRVTAEALTTHTVGTPITPSYAVRESGSV